jgi:hypothetical protein
MRIPPDSPRAERIRLLLGRFLGFWTIGVVALTLTAILVLLILHFTGIVELADS